MKNALAALTLCLLTACATVRPGNQSAEVRAEQTLSVSLAALDSFVAFEHRRRADVPPLVRDWDAEQARIEAESDDDVKADRKRLREWERSNALDKGAAPTVREKYRRAPKPDFLK